MVGGGGGGGGGDSILHWEKFVYNSLDEIRIF